MKSLHRQYVTEISQQGLIDGLANLIADGRRGNINVSKLEKEFPDGPQEFITSFVEQYPELSNIDIRETLDKAYAKANEMEPQDDFISMLLQSLGNMSGEPIDYVTARNCKNPNCQNPACPNYKGRRLSGKSKIGYIN